MCGIGGSAGPKPLSDAVGKRVLESLQHRGPDAQGRRDWCGTQTGWTLLHTRLSIVDLSDAANQPMPNEDESLWMAFNGEIYNAPELRRYCESKGHRFRSTSDGEVILHLWEMEGWQALRRLNGIFSVAIADARSGEVNLARDPMGVKPLYFARGPANQLWFGSEIRTLAATGCALGELDTTALAQFLTFLWVPDPRTPYANVKSIEPGHVLRWHPDGLDDVAFSEVTTLANSAEPGGASFDHHLGAAVERQLMADVPLAIMASGGIDSSLVWRSARGSLSRAFTIDWSRESGDEGLHEDTRAVQDLELSESTPVRYVQGREADLDALPPSGDLFADPAYHLVRSIAAEASREGFKVLLSGQGGDELLAGYRRHQAARFLGRTALGPVSRAAVSLTRRLRSESLRAEYLARLTAAVAAPDPFAGYLTLCSYSSPTDRARALDCTEAEVADDVVWARHRHVYESLPARWSMLRKARVLDLAVYLPGLGLAYTDRAGMDASVEVRVPFLDLELVAWSLGVDDSELVRWGKGKVPARTLARTWFGNSIANRPKRGFGVPREMLEPAQEGSDRGFRQSQYFTLATRVMERYRETDAASRSS